VLIEQTQRGFNYGDFTDVSGQKCSIQESSLATEWAIWFGLDNVKWGRMHLTRPMVQAFMPFFRAVLAKPPDDNDLGLYWCPDRLLFHDRYQTPVEVFLDEKRVIHFKIGPRQAWPEPYQDFNSPGCEMLIDKSLAKVLKPLLTRFFTGRE